MKVRKRFDNRDQYPDLQAQKGIDGKWMVEYDIVLNKDKVLNNLLQYMDKYDLYYDFYPGCIEPGYDDVPIIAADWNGPSQYKDDKWDWNPDGGLTARGQARKRMDRLNDFITHYWDGEISPEWSDEWSACGECGKAVRSSPNSYSWEPYYILDEGMFQCGECAKKDPEMILQGYINNSRKAIPSWMIEKANSQGFDCIEEDEYINACKQYETGWHPGQNDTPQGALEDAYAIMGKEWFQANMDFIFCITGQGQFDTSWTILVRPKSLNEGD